MNKHKHQSTPFFYSFLLLSVAFVIGLCCKKNNTGGPSSSAKRFTLPLPSNGKIAGMAYDRDARCLYMLEQLDTSLIALYQYDVASGSTYPVYTDSSHGMDGMRVFGDSIYLISGRDRRVTVLQKQGIGFEPLNVAVWKDHYPEGYEAVADLSIFGGRIYFVSDPYQPPHKANGVWNAVLNAHLPFYYWEFANILADSWDWNGVGKLSRSVLSSLDFLVIAPGGTNKIELRRRITGELVTQVEGHGDSFLQQDSEYRVYALDAGRGKVIRWNFDLTAEEGFPQELLLATGNSSVHMPFAIRDDSDNPSIYFPVTKKNSVDIWQMDLPK